MRIKVPLLIIFIAIRLAIAHAQTEVKKDTLVLTLGDAERLFLKNNFELLAAGYRISQADAAVIQAKLWDNPTISIDREAFNKGAGKWYLLSGSGEYSLSFQQLIYLAGKKNKRVDIEKINTNIAQYEFYDLIRTLRYELRTSFYQLYFSQRSLAVYDREIEALKILTQVYEGEYSKGNVPLRELARLRTLQFGLENEKIDVLKTLNEQQSNLVLLIGDTLARPIRPIADLATFDKIDPTTFNLSQLVDTGLHNRFDLRIADARVRSEEINLLLQKSMRVPDITLGANYDKLGGYVPSYNSLSLSFNLPLWNYNRGNIKISENRIKESKAGMNYKELEIKNDIIKAFAQFIETDRLFRNSSQKFDENYEKMFIGINTAYKDRTISLLEFIDYYEAYKDAKNQYYQLQNNRLESLENLNMATGTTLFK